MKHTVTVLLFAIAALAACKSSKKAENYGQMVKESPDAKPTLYVAADDQRYVSGGATEGRQIHYYSQDKDLTYVIDENTGTILTTMKGKTPEVQIVETRKFVVVESDETMEEESAKGDDEKDEGACGKGDDDKDDDACGEDDDDKDDDACGEDDDDDDACGEDDDG